MTMTHIETIELASTTASITFSSISQDFTDLLIKVSARSTRTGATQDLLQIKPNGAGGFSYIVLLGTGSAVANGSGSTTAIGYAPSADTTSNTFGNTDIYISNYTRNADISISSDVVAENNATDARQAIFAGIATAGTAITSILMDLNSADFTADSTFSLYGIS